MKFKNYLGIAVVLLTMVGCSEEFLETEPTEFVSSSQITEFSEDNPGLQAANISGIYSLMYQTGTGGTNLDHDDYGQKGYDVYSDLLSSDVVLAGLTYGWYSGISRMQSTIDYTDTDNYKPWRYYYRIVFSANNVIDGLGGNDAELESPEAILYMGQAKAMRAYAYFYLAQLFQEGNDMSEPILPIYTDTETDAQPLSPASEVYALMVSDLTEAVELLDGTTRNAIQEVDKSVAQGLLAYVYAAMGDYEQVKTITEDVINTGGYSILTADQVVYSPETQSGGGFNDVNNPSWMWGVDLTSDQGLDLVSWWGQMDIFTYSYAFVGDPKSIDLGLYEAIPDGDVRKDQFQIVEGFGENQPLAINKFFAPARTEGGQRNITTDYVYMRIEEMYLLHAEAAAKTGDEAAAKMILTTLLSERMDDTSYLDGLSGQALEDEIYLQTRIEFWGEGKSYLAMKRNEATITRASNHLTDAGATIPYNDDRLTFEIPQSEIQNNPNITEQ